MKYIIDKFGYLAGFIVFVIRILSFAFAIPVVFSKVLILFFTPAQIASVLDISISNPEIPLDIFDLWVMGFFALAVSAMIVFIIIMVTVLFYEAYSSIYPPRKEKTD